MDKYINFLTSTIVMYAFLTNDTTFTSYAAHCQILATEKMVSRVERIMIFIRYKVCKLQ